MKKLLYSNYILPWIILDVVYLWTYYWDVNPGIVLNLLGTKICREIEKDLRFFSFKNFLIVYPCVGFWMSQICNPITAQKFSGTLLENYMTMIRLTRSITNCQLNRKLVYSGSSKNINHTYFNFLDSNST